VARAQVCTTCPPAAGAEPARRSRGDSVDRPKIKTNYHWIGCALLQCTAKRSHWQGKRSHTGQHERAPLTSCWYLFPLTVLSRLRLSFCTRSKTLQELIWHSFTALRVSAQNHAAYHTCAGRYTRGCLSSRTRAARTSTLRCRRAPAARWMSWPGQTRGPAQQTRGSRRQRGKFAACTQCADCCKPSVMQACPAGRASDWRSLRARLVVGPAVLPARRARHVRDRAPRVHYHRKLPLWRAQHERCVEVPADRAATAPRTLGLCATPQHLYQLARSATNPAAARERKPVNSRQARDYAAARSPAPALLSASKCSSAALPTQQAPL